MIGEAVVDGVGRIPGFVNAYVYEDPSGTYLIDTTMSRNAKPVRRAFEHADADLGRISTILLTHQHLDHIRGASSIERVNGAVVACHTADAPYVDGSTPRQSGLMMRLFFPTQNVRVKRTLSDGDSIGPFRVVFAPGHTVGEVAFYQPDRRLLFSGDSVVERKGQLTLPGRRFAADLAQAVASLQILRRLEIEVLLPGHGVPVRNDVAARLDDLIRRAPSEFPGTPATGP